MGPLPKARTVDLEGRCFRVCHVLRWLLHVYTALALCFETDLPRMRDANYSVDVFERGCQELVGQDARRVFEPKQTMIRKHRTHAEKVGMQDAFLTQRREARMRMNQVNMLPNDDRPKVREEREIIRQGSGGSDGHEGNVVHLERG